MPDLTRPPFVRFDIQTMALGILAKFMDRSPRRDEVIVLDLGARVTKAVHLRKEEAIVYLHSFVCLDAPTGDKRESAAAWKEHFAELLKTIGGKTTNAILVLSADESRVLLTEVPPAGAADLRRSVHHGSKAYFQEDLQNFLFDCQILPTVQAAKQQASADDVLSREEGKTSRKPSDPAGESPSFAGSKAPPRVRALIGGAREGFVSMLRGAASEIGLSVQGVALGQISPAAAFRSMPTPFQKEAVALVDIGFHRSVITILLGNAPLLTRVVNIGGDRFTSGLADTMNITYAVAEGIKQVMPEKVQAKLQSLIAPLAEELRNSINFVEKEFEKSVGEVYVSGSSARSNLIIHLLETETIVPCKGWNPTSALTLDMPGPMEAEAAKVAPQLADAIGAGLAWFQPDFVQLNLLAEEIEAIEERRRDPVRRGSYVAAAVLVLMVLWVTLLGASFWRMDQQLAAEQEQLKRLERTSVETTRYSRQAGQVEKVLNNLRTLTTNRFLWAPVLNALQFCVVDRVEVTRLELDRSLAVTPGTKTVTNANNRITMGKPDSAVEKIVLRVQAKDYGNPPMADLFIETLASHEYFAANLRPKDSIRLVERSPRQVDPFNPNRSFILFTVECYYAEKQFRGD